MENFPLGGHCISMPPTVACLQERVAGMLKKNLNCTLLMLSNSFYKNRRLLIYG